MSINNLTVHPPRSPRVRLGGYAILPRILDKGRAKLEGTLGEYQYPGPLDSRFHTFAGTTPEEILEQLEAGKGDGDVLKWIQENARNKRTDVEISTWSDYQDHRAPAANGYRKHYAASVEKLAPHRDDLITSFDLLDLDDFVSFGGKP